MNKSHNFLYKYAAEVGFEVNYIKNDFKRVIAECKYIISTRCGWYVQGRVDTVNRFFCAKKFNGEHTCGVAYRNHKHSCLSLGTIANKITNHVRTNNMTRPLTLSHIFQMSMVMILNIIGHGGLEKNRRDMCLAINHYHLIG